VQGIVITPQTPGWLKRDENLAKAIFVPKCRVILVRHFGSKSSQRTPVAFFTQVALFKGSPRLGFKNLLKQIFETQARLATQDKVKARGLKSQE